ncbi:MAG: hypothetical protein GY874_22840 [Desulfobacteraceae bacterium]|nr:hypothetical protein [Desulfobacteraceae bacterium]
MRKLNLLVIMFFLFLVLAGCNLDSTEDIGDDNGFALEEDTGDDNGFALEIEATITHENEEITLLMTQESVRGENFEVLVQNESGTYDSYTLGEAQTFIGSVEEYPGAIAAGILKADGTLWAQVYFDRGLTWKILGDSVYDVKGDFEPTFSFPTSSTVSAGDAGFNTYRFDIGIDLDYNYYRQRTDVAECLEAVEFTISQIKAMYLRDVLLQPALGRVIIRTSREHCPYNSASDTRELLRRLRIEWSTNHTDADRDLAALSSANINGGIAQLKQVGTAYAYSVNKCDISTGAFDSILKHEMAHNWSVRDHQAGDPEGKTIACGNQYGRFAGPSVKNVFAYRDNRLGVLDNMGIYTTVNIPPYAALDTFEYSDNQNSELIIYPLENDHDVNGDNLSLVSFDTFTENDGFIEKISGTTSSTTGLLYTPPSDAMIGQEDWFYYTIEDSDGKVATGVVTIQKK